MDLAQLLSPPDPRPSDTFSLASDSAQSSRPAAAFSGTSDDCPAIYSSHKGNMGRLPSPPVTPASKARQLGDELVMSENRRSSSFGHAFDDQDPVLFPPDCGRSPPTPQALFSPGPDAPADVDDVITQHMSMQMNRFRHSYTKPTRDEYRLALACVPVVETNYVRAPAKWAQQERRILDERFRHAHRVWKRPADALLPKITPMSHSKKPSTSRPRQPRAARTPKRTPVNKPLSSFELGVSSTPKRVIGTSRDDVDFGALLDIAPPLETLSVGHPKALKADWRGQMLDLSLDPHRHLLHEAEIHLASTLRLSCATYLCSKRRIFLARLDALRIGKEFRKTDSQQACKIDVNKASKLWTAFEKVGWFNPEYFRQWL
ncbi:MAG: hypothetical protein M1817_004472 [Caeruleum heppii]|nr:MAG: hypothetical protein M1817_004472 [Caeruleum heppii]